MLTVVTAFNRKENLPHFEKILKGKCNWIVLRAPEDEPIDFPDWVTVKTYEITHKNNIANRLLNEFINHGLEPETQYFTLNDDDSVEEGFFDKIPNKDVIIVAMQRTDYGFRHVVWDNWDKKEGHWENGIDILKACPENIKIASVGGDQLIIKGKVWRNFRNGLNPNGDGEMIKQIAEEYPITYVNDTHVYFNYLEEGRWKHSRKRKQVLFVGDYYRGASPDAGVSEWEGGIWKSLESCDVVDVARFHYDKYWWEMGKHNNGTQWWWGDKLFMDKFYEIKPDLVILVLYKAPNGADPTVISLNVVNQIKESGVPIVAIWGDLESMEQRWLSHAFEPWVARNVATASKEIADEMGYTYLHVPRDPSIFNNPNRERNLDIVFSGSSGTGREDRQRAIQALLDNGIKIIWGGSECGDHFPVEQYADRYKQAKMALSFSTACGKNVVNARVFEVMNCGALLMEKEGDELKKLYTPYEDYVPWTDEADLVKKVKYYLEHEDERKRIADSGCKKTQELYSAKKFWDVTLKDLI